MTVDQVGQGATPERKAKMIIAKKDIRTGERVVIDKVRDGFYIKLQEHESICGGYIDDADKDEWRDCLWSFEYTFEAAEKEMNRLFERGKAICNRNAG